MKNKLLALFLTLLLLLSVSPLFCFAAEETPAAS